MNDQFNAGPLPQLTPEQESEVRRLLAEARHDEPVPADVAARLDRALADLSLDEPVQPDEPAAPVIDLAARRRRRNAAALLAGAAAVIVAGFAIGQVIDVGGGSADDNASGSSTVARDDAAGGSAETQSDGLLGSAPSSSPPTKPEATKEAPVQLRSSHLRRDIEKQLAYLSAVSGSVTSDQALGDFSAANDCPTRSAAETYGIGHLFPAYYDGIPAVLALAPPTNGTREAQVLSCATGERLRSVTVTTR